MLVAILNHHDCQVILDLIASNYHKTDIFELRLDSLISSPKFNLETIACITNKIKGYHKPVIFTLRSQDNGGLYTGDEQSRFNILLSLARLEPDYIDLEYDVPTDFFKIINNQYPNIKIICSYHEFNNKQLDVTYLNKILDSIISQTQNVVIHTFKLVFTARSNLDNLVVFNFLQNCKNNFIINQAAINIHCMGEQGQLSRILGKRFGNKFTYCTLETNQQDDYLTQLGVIKLDELLNIYNYSNLNKDTKIFCLIGNPVSNSLGHLFHNDYYRKNNINAIYIKVLVNNLNELDNFFTLLAELPIDGCSVTMPYKQDIVKYIVNAKDEKNLTSYNTIKKINNKFYGINTDGVGAIAALLNAESENFNCLVNKLDIKNKRVLILGAGGAAEGIITEFAKYQPKEILIINRTYHKAERFIKFYGCSVLTFEDNRLEQPYDYIINTIAYNLDNHAKAIVLNKINKILNFNTHDRTIYLDINYNQSDNQNHSSTNNCIMISGYSMFVKQAEKQIEYWLS